MNDGTGKCLIVRANASTGCSTSHAPSSLPKLKNRVVLAGESIEHSRCTARKAASIASVSL